MKINSAHSLKLWLSSMFITCYSVGCSVLKSLRIYRNARINRNRVWKKIWLHGYPFAHCLYTSHKDSLLLWLKYKSMEDSFHHWGDKRKKNTSITTFLVYLKFQVSSANQKALWMTSFPSYPQMVQSQVHSKSGICIVNMEKFLLMLIITACFH